MSEELRKQIGSQNSQMWKQQDSWVPHWREIQEIMLPYRGRLDDSSTQNDGKRRADNRMDGTATRALRILASGMHGGLTSPSQRWFRLGLGDQSLARFSTVRRWLDDVENIIYGHLRISNFYTAVQNVYIEQGGFGTACLFNEENTTGKGVWFKVSTIGDFACATDSLGRINTVSRRDWLTAKQLVDTFGIDSVSEPVKRAYEKTPYQFFKVFQFIQPRMKRDLSKIDKMNKKFESMYFEDANNLNFLGVGGFNEFPAIVPRWDTVGSNTYGYSPGMDALPDVLGLNKVSEDLLIAVNKEIDPPVNVPDSFGEEVDLLPGGRNPSSGNEHVTATYQISPQLSAGFEIKNGSKNDIADWFYTNLFILTANPNATATEIARKNEEQLVQLGPVIQRQFTENLNPVIERTFAILNRQGLIPEPPPEIQDKEVEIEYISTLAQAQKLVGVQKIERFTGFVGNIAGVDPSVLDKVDIDAVVDSYADGVGTPGKFLRSQQEVDQIRQARAQQQQLAMQNQQLAEGAQTAATMSNAKLEDSNLLSELVAGATDAAA